MSANADAYRMNLTEAKAELARAGAKMGRLRDAGFVYWGKIKRKGLPDYEGWLVKGGIDGDADKAFTAWAKCLGEVEHWARLLLEELDQPQETTAAPEGLPF